MNCLGGRIGTRVNTSMQFAARGSPHLTYSHCLWSTIQPLQKVSKSKRKLMYRARALYIALQSLKNRATRTMGNCQSREKGVGSSMWLPFLFASYRKREIDFICPTLTPRSFICFVHLHDFAPTGSKAMRIAKASQSLIRPPIILVLDLLEIVFASRNHE